MYFTISSRFLSQKTAHQLPGRQRFFKAGRHFLVNVCAWIALTALWFQHALMKPRFHRLLLIRCDWEIHRHVSGCFCYRSEESQSGNHSLLFVYTWEVTNSLVNILNKIISHYRWPADHFAVHREFLFARPSLNILHQCLIVPSLMTFWP